MSEVINPKSRYDRQQGDEPLQGSPETANVFDRETATAKRRKTMRLIGGATALFVAVGIGAGIGRLGGEEKVGAKAPAVATAPANPGGETAPVVTPEATPTPFDLETFRETFPYQTIDEEGSVTKYESRDAFVEAMRVPAVDPATGKEVSGEEALKKFVDRFNIQLNTAADVPTHKAYRSFEDPEDPRIPSGAEAIAEAVYNNAFNEALYYKEGADVGLAETLAENHDGLVAATLANTDEVEKGQPKLSARYTYANTDEVGKRISAISRDVGKMKIFYAGNVLFNYDDNGGSIPDIANERLADKKTESIDEDGNVHREYTRAISLRTTDDGKYWLIDGSHS